MTDGWRLRQLLRRSGRARLETPSGWTRSARNPRKYGAVGLIGARFVRLSRLTGVAASGAAILMAGCGAAVGGHVTEGAATPSAHQSATSTPSPLPNGKAALPAGLGLLTLNFVSPSHGFALGETCSAATGACRAAVIATADGGTQWHSVAAPPAMIGNDSATCGVVLSRGNAAVSELSFATRSAGWAWGPGLFATQDGAASWRAVTTAGPVLALAVAGPYVWAVESHCGGSGGQHDPPILLMRAPVGGGTWATVAGLPTVAATAAILEATTPAQAWLEVAAPHTSGDGNGTALSLYRTSDSGATWETLDDPCTLSSPGGPTAPLAVSGKSVWIACGGGPGAGGQEKVIYTSPDGGQTWSVAGSTGPLGSSATPAPGGVPQAGYVAQLTLTGSGVGWLALARGTLVVSRDGGRTWSAVIPIDAVASGSGIVSVTFSTPTTGWALASSGGSNVIYRTVDGGSVWAPIHLR